jgi:hypothetical protein
MNSDFRPHPITGTLTSLSSLTYEEIFEAAARIIIFVDRRITVGFAGNTISVRFPTTRKLAEHLQIPHYYVLPYFAAMEKEEMITRVERIGISTTNKGSKKLIALIAARYKKEAENIMGSALFNELQQRLMLEDHK